MDGLSYDTKTGASHDYSLDPEKPRLLDQVRNAMRARHMALSTEKAYVDWIRQFILFHGKRHPRELGNAEVSHFLTHLAVERNVASSTQNQALSALLFLYRHVLEEDFGWLTAPTSRPCATATRASDERGLRRSRNTACIVREVSQCRVRVWLAVHLCCQQAVTGSSQPEVPSSSFGSVGAQ